MSDEHDALLQLYAEWLDMVAEDEAGQPPADDVIVGTLATIRAVEAPLDEATRNAVWARAKDLHERASASLRAASRP